MHLVDPDIHNSNPGEFRGPRLRVQAHDLKFPEQEALEAVRQFIIEYGEDPTSRSWQAAGMTPAEHTIRNLCGNRSPASSIAIIARIAVGVVNTLVAPWRDSTSSCLAGSKPPSRW